MVRPRQLEPEQVEDAGDDVEVAGDVQVEGVVRRQEQGQVGHVAELVRRRQHVVLDDPVREQVRQPADDPHRPRSGPIVQRGVGPVGVAERLEVEDREEQEADVRQREEVGRP